MARMTRQEVEARLWDAANILRGPIDAADFKTYIFPLLFFKRISDVYDEEFQAALKESGGDVEYASFGENHRFDVPSGCHWNDVFERTENIGYALNQALREIELANPDRLYGIFGDAQWGNKQRLSDGLMRRLLDHFNRLDLSNAAVPDDLMGRAYEYLIKKFADAANKKAGEFYTPRSIVRLMVNILDPQPMESVYDPACGTGGMLLETINHVRESGGEWRNLIVRGQESNLTTAAIARMNLFLHGIEDFDVVRGDTLRDPKFHREDALERFHCVIANPPFSLKNWGREVWERDPYGRNRWGLPTKSKGDLAWLAHMLTSMHPTRGRVAVVLPLGALFRTGAEARIRRAIIENDLVEAVIELGPNLFYGTGIPAAIVVFRRRKPDELKHKVLFINAAEIYTKGRAQNTLQIDQADEIYSLYAGRAERPGTVAVVDVADVAENGFNLNVGLYLPPDPSEDISSLEEALAVFEHSMAHLTDAEDRLEALLQKEGLV